MSRQKGGVIWRFVVAFTGFRQIGGIDADERSMRTSDPGLSWRHFITKVRGVSMRNQDGSYRQRLVAACRPGEQMILVREPKNPVDPCAVKVCRLDGLAVGYIRAETAAWFHEVLDRGQRYEVVVREVTGRKRRRGTLGLIIELTAVDSRLENNS